MTDRQQAKPKEQSTGSQGAPAKHLVNETAGAEMPDADRKTESAREAAKVFEKEVGGEKKDRN